MGCPWAPGSPYRPHEWSVQEIALAHQGTLLSKKKKCLFKNINTDSIQMKNTAGG